jgi:hypothetical protein
MQRFDTVGVINIPGVVIDLDGDGSPELVVRTTWSIGGRYRCLPVQKKIYQCNATTCSDVSDHFGTFFTNELRRVEAAIAVSAADPASDESHCKTMERDQLLRFLGLDPHVGFDMATNLTRSADPDDRIDAISIFFNIADRASNDRLEALTRDQNSGVAYSAQLVLRRLNEK